MRAIRVLLTLLLLIICSDLLAAKKLYVPKESKRDAISRYRSGCRYGPDKKKIVNITYCAPLGEVLEQLDKSEAAKRAYARGCKNKDWLSCVRLGNVFIEAEDQKNGDKYYTKACNGGYQPGCEKLKKEKESNILIIMAVLLIGIVSFIITNTIFQEESQFKASEKLEDGGAKEEAGKHGAILKYSRPFFKRYISPVVSSFKAKNRIREKYKRVLAASGLTSVLTPDDFFSFKLFLIIGFPIVYLGVRAFLEETWPLSYIPVISIFGYMYPDLWIKGKIKKRQKEVITELPFCVDMLALSVEAGLDFVAAMQKVIEKAKKSAISEEFEILLKEIKVGASRAEALRNMAWRIDLIQVSSFTATLIAADSVGASIGPILKNLSAEIRQKKSADAEKAGATAATKILFPMLFLITPAVFIIVAAPMVLEFLKG